MSRETYAHHKGVGKQPAPVFRAGAIESGPNHTCAAIFLSLELEGNDLVILYNYY